MIPALKFGYPQRRQKHLFNPFQGTSIYLTAISKCNKHQWTHTATKSARPSPCNDERRTEGILLDMYKDASIGLAASPFGTATTWKMRELH